MTSEEIQNIFEATVRLLYTDQNQVSSNRPAIAFADSVPSMRSSTSFLSDANQGSSADNSTRQPNPCISHSAGQLFPASTMPNVPESVIEKIREGKFVDLSTCIDTIYIDEDPKFSLIPDKGEGDGLSLVKKTHSKKIQSFQEWMKAYSLYMRAVFLIKPALVGQMIVYFF